MLLHYSEITNWPWKKFTPRELACPCCGEFYISNEMYDAVDRLHRCRIESGIPFILNSAHRCIIHNAMVGGAPLSAHKKIAFDISLRRHDRFILKVQLAKVGFTTFGLYRTFIHTDPRYGRLWIGKGANKLWNG